MFSFNVIGGYDDNGCFSHYLEIAFSPVDAAGDPIAGWTTVYVDIFYLDSSSSVSYLDRSGGSFQDVQLTDLGSTENNVFAFREQLTTTAQSWLTANRGRTLFFNFKNSTSASQTDQKTKLYTGRVAFENDMFHILTDVTNARLSWIRNDVENVLFPRTKRLLQFTGENLLLDNFTYDNAGNITGLRIRGFDLKTNAEAATIDHTSVEPGEDLTVSVKQNHNLPRNVRSSHLSTPEADADDADATANNVTDSTDAPGNTGTWPSS